MDQEQARHNIEKFVAERRYTYTADQLVENYLKYYKNGYYVSHTTKDCIKHLGSELEVLTQCVLRKRGWCSG